MTRFEDEWKLLVQARSWITARDYVLAETHGPGDMGSAMDRYTGAQIELRIAADRGQWFVDVRPTGRKNRDEYNLEAWAAAIGRPVLFHGTRDEASRPLQPPEDAWRLAPQMEFLRLHLDEIARACSLENLETTLTAVAEAWAGLMAFPPRRVRRKSEPAGQPPASG